MGHAAGDGEARIAAVSDLVQEAENPGVLPEDLGARGNTTRPNGPGPMPPVARDGAGEPRLTPARIAARVVETRPQLSGRTVDRGHRPELVAFQCPPEERSA